MMASFNSMVMANERDLLTRDFNNPKEISLESPDWETGEAKEYVQKYRLLFQSKIVGTFHWNLSVFWNQMFLLARRRRRSEGKN